MHIGLCGVPGFGFCRFLLGGGCLDHRQTVLQRIPGGRLVQLLLGQRDRFRQTAAAGQRSVGGGGILGKLQVDAIHRLHTDQIVLAQGGVDLHIQCVKCLIHCGIFHRHNGVAAAVSVFLRHLADIGATKQGGFVAVQEKDLAGVQFGKRRAGRQGHFQLSLPVEGRCLDRGIDSGGILPDKGPDIGIQGSGVGFRTAPVPAGLSGQRHHGIRLCRLVLRRCAGNGTFGGSHDPVHNGRCRLIPEEGSPAQHNAGRHQNRQQQCYQLFHGTIFPLCR